MIFDQLPATVDAGLDAASSSDNVSPALISAQPRALVQPLKDRLQRAFEASVQDETIDPFSDAVLPPGAPPIQSSDMQNDWKLSAVLRSTRGGCAIVDGHPVHVGETYRGYRLVTVDPGRAVFEREADNAQLILRLGK
ncbi:MAG TPA: hypothetical protein PKB10_00045 [Tepidisphaeraceae bacterium]|nr:hypothetical protein [Tepidisphaeraceae bacterium]